MPTSTLHTLTLTLGLSLSFGVGCIVVVGPDGEPEPDRDPIRTECDADGDGVQSPDCGGLDCDDLDATIRPGADEWFGDDVDQDCDGRLDARRDTFDLPSRTEVASFDWGPELRTLGGVLVQPTGAAVAQDLELAPRFGGEVVLKRRSTYAAPAGELTAVRLPGPVDLLADDSGLTAWSPDGPEGTRLWARPDLVPGRFDAALQHEEAGAAWVLSCEGGGVELRALDLQSGQDRASATLDQSVDACALLGHRDGAPVILLTLDQTLERWVYTSEGFTDRLVLARNLGEAEVHAVGGVEAGVLAWLEDGVITVLDRDARGVRLGEGHATDRYDIAITAGGDLVASWVDTDGLAWIAEGPVEGPVLSASVDDAHADVHTLAVGALDDELAVALQDDAGLTLLRARR